jgi:hypothetical protein
MEETRHIPHGMNTPMRRLVKPVIGLLDSTAAFIKFLTQVHKCLLVDSNCELLLNLSRCMHSVACLCQCGKHLGAAIHWLKFQHEIGCL